MTLKTKYDLGDRVKILPLDSIPAKVIAIFHSASCTEYKAKYFLGGECKTEFFEDDELKRDSKGRVGK